MIRLDDSIKFNNFGEVLATNFYSLSDRNIKVCAVGFPAGCDWTHNCQPQSAIIYFFRKYKSRTLFCLLMSSVGLKVNPHDITVSWNIYIGVYQTSLPTGGPVSVSSEESGFRALTLGSGTLAKSSSIV